MVDLDDNIDDRGSYKLTLVGKRFSLFIKILVVIFLIGVTLVGTSHQRKREGYTLTLFTPNSLYTQFSACLLLLLLSVSVPKLQSISSRTSLKSLLFSILKSLGNRRRRVRRSNGSTARYS